MPIAAIPRLMPAIHTAGSLEWSDPGDRAVDASNIDQSGVTKRAVLGLVLLAAAIGLSLWLSMAGGSPWLRFATWPCFFAAVICLLQASRGV